VLDKLKESNLKNQEKTAALYTDSLITVYSLKNMNNHNAIIEGIRSSLRTLEAEGWNIQSSWVKAYVGILDYELADHLAKQPALDENLQIYYSYER
jgi:RNase H.